MKSYKVAFALLFFAALIACGSQEEELEISDQPNPEMNSPANLEAADTSTIGGEMGTEHEGPDKKDLEKKSADFDPAEVKLGNEGK